MAGTNKPLEPDDAFYVRADEDSDVLDVPGILDMGEVQPLGGFGFGGCGLWTNVGLIGRFGFGLAASQPVELTGWQGLPNRHC